MEEWDVRLMESLGVVEEGVSSSWPCAGDGNHHVRTCEQGKKGLVMMTSSGQEYSQNSQLRWDNEAANL